MFNPVMLTRLRDIATPRAAGGLILAASLAALAGAFFAQYVGGLEPCPLCLYQRYPYAATIVLAGLAMATAGRGRWPALFLGVAGAVMMGEAGLAFYHVGVEQGWFEGLAACVGAAGETPATLEELRAQLLAAPPARCDVVPWSLFGISMAGFNVVYSAVLAVIGLAVAARLARRRTP